MSSNTSVLSGKRRQILQYIEESLRTRGFPPSVREIGEAVGLSSSSTVHTHLGVLEEQGFLRRHPTIPRAIEVCWDPGSDTVLERRPTRYPGCGRWCLSALLLLGWPWPCACPCACDVVWLPEPTGDCGCDEAGVDRELECWFPISRSRSGDD